MMRNQTVSAAFALLMALSAGSATAQTAATQSFPTAEQAVRALYDAVRKDDRNALTKILGAGNDLVGAEDPDEDRRDRERFVHKYDEMHRLVREGDLTVLYIGAENWPFSFPLVEQNARWHFDAKAGMEEVLARRIGENELAAIATSRALASEKQDNLPPADAALRVNVGEDQLVAFHGYYFRRLPGGQEVLAYP